MTITRGVVDGPIGNAPEPGGLGYKGIIGELIFEGTLKGRLPCLHISSVRPFGYTVEMSKRLVDIDDDLLEEASTALGATTMKEAVNRSLESVVLAARRRRHADRLESMDGLDLAKPKVMSGAWR